MRKKVDSRIRTLIENGVKLNQRTMFLVVGDKGRDQVMNLHYMMSKASIKPRPSVLWCYKKDLGFSSHKRKRIKQIKRDIHRGLREADQNDPFELFITTTHVRYTYYKDTHKILGSTFGMCVLQDFEAMTPNLLARTIETVEGGGITVILLKTMTSLKQLYQMTMDVHSRYRTESHQDVVARFTERFLLSITSCLHCLAVDDELNVLKVSSHAKNITPVPLPRQEDDESANDAHLTPAQNDLKILKKEMADTPPIGALVEICKTLDQAKALLNFASVIQEKTLRSTVAMTAARGRGKSAALGIAIAMAVAHGYSNIFVTSPSPENLGTLFQIMFKAFDALKYQDHLDYEIVQSTNPSFNKAVVRVNVFREHRQTIQYIQPGDHVKLSQAELVVIDEAAAIPLTLVKKLMGPYLVFMSSTVNGYEGTGRSLSLKLIQDLRQKSVSASSSSGGRTLTEITLEEPIRYSDGDPVEKWLTELLCLDCTGKGHRIVTGTPHPSQCELYHVNRDTLFSYHKASESFLQRMISLYVSSHYKNTPDDLLLMSDAPAHRLFVLLNKKALKKEQTLPDILAVVQVSLEGEISKNSVKSNLSRGKRASGDLIPWTISQQFQDHEFATLSGARVVRIAVHPDVQKMGYGTRALELLTKYYQGDITNLEESEEKQIDVVTEPEISSKGLLKETLKPKKNLPPLLHELQKRNPEPIHYLGVSYGMTLKLFGFWNRSGFKPVYVRQTPNDLTGEHTCIMIKPLEGAALQRVPNSDWLDGFTLDFKRRFLSLLSFQFHDFSCTLALSVLNPDKELISTSSSSNQNMQPSKSKRYLSYEELNSQLTVYDLKRLESYASHLVDYHMVLDLIPTIAQMFFLSKLNLSLSYSQCAILLGIGLQRKSVDEIVNEFSITPQQVLAQFNKIVRKISKFLRRIVEKHVQTGITQTEGVTAAKRVRFESLQQTLDEDMADAAQGAQTALARHQEELLGSINLQQFQIDASKKDWEQALSTNSLSTPSTLSVKKQKSKKHKRGKDDTKSSSEKSKKSKKHKKSKHKTL